MEKVRKEWKSECDQTAKGRGNERKRNQEREGEREGGRGREKGGEREPLFPRRLVEAPEVWQIYSPQLTKRIRKERKRERRGGERERERERERKERERREERGERPQLRETSS